MINVCRKFNAAIQVYNLLYAKNGISASRKLHLRVTIHFVYPNLVVNSTVKQVLKISDISIALKMTFCNSGANAVTWARMHVAHCHLARIYAHL